MVSGVKTANGVQGFRVLVQSGKISGFVERRIESFLSKAYVSSYHTPLLVVRDTLYL